MIGQGKSGWFIASIAAAVVLTSIGYGMGKRAALKSVADTASITPAGSPLPGIQIEPIQPQEEIAAINAGTTNPAAVTEAVVPSTEITQTTAPALDAGAAAGPTAVASAPTEESERVKEVQVALRAAGFDPGSTDGKLGPRTRAAVRDFQLANGLEADGKVGPRTWAKLEPYLKSQGSSTQGQ